MVAETLHITDEDFDEALKNVLGPYLFELSDVAVGVSGGADSMLLCHLLSSWSERAAGVHIHALSVDHGLREEARDEAEKVRALLSELPNVQHHILTWDEGAQAESRIQERAREARYDLMRTYLQDRGLRFLFLGHHMDDQAETFLFRLAKGSGLDGLSCMSALQDIEGDIFLVRPLLRFSKQSIITTCNERKIEFIHDPSNENDAFARVRLRQSMDILAEEGLTSKRLSQTATRLSRARKALEDLSDGAFEDAILEFESSCVVFNFEALREQPDEIVFRVLMRGIHAVSGKDGYGPRMEKAEDLFYDLMQPIRFRKRTLYGVIIELNHERSRLVITKEDITEE